MNYQKSIYPVLIVLVFLLITGCARQLVKPIDEDIPVNPSLSEVRNNTANFVGARVRWGGVIASVFNEQESTLIEIVSRPLSNQGRPLDGDSTYGRFIARMAGFLDPVVYAKGRDITVVGAISGEEKRLIDSFEYQYVAVQVDAYKLWQPVEDRPYYYYYDPFWYGPWYPYYRWPHYYKHGHKKPAKK